MIYKRKYSILLLLAIMTSFVVPPLSLVSASSVVIVNDTFTETAGVSLENHISETGASYTQIMGTPDMTNITAENKLRASSTGVTEYLASGVATSADYMVQADLTVKSLVDEGLYGLIGRSSADGQYQYIARYNAYPTNASWELYVHNGGLNYVRIGNVPQVLNIGQTYNLKLTMVGDAIKVYVDDILIIDVQEVSIASIGQAGIEIGYQDQGAIPSDETGMVMDNFAVSMEYGVAPVFELIADDTYLDTQGTSLENHVGETGSLYTQIMGTPNMTNITAENKLRASSTGIAEYLASGVATSADYQIQADLTIKSIVDEGLYGVIGRSSADGQYQYIARYNAYQANRGWELYVHNGPDNYVLIGNVPQELNVGRTYTLKMALLANTIKVYVDNNMIINLSDSSISNIGQAGIEIGYQDQGAQPSDETGIMMDNFVVSVGDKPVEPSNVLVDEDSLYFSPYNWRKVDNSYAITQTPGAYIKTVFTGRLLNINLSEDLLTGSAVNTGYYPRLRYKIDSQPDVEVQLTPGISVIKAASGLAPGSHDLLITFPHVSGGEAGQPDRWQTPVHGLKFTGLTIDNGATTSLPTLKPKRLLVYGDSISEGVLVNANTGSSPNTDSDATKAVSQLLANDLNAEVGFRALGGGGWTIAGSGGVPPIYTPGDDGASMWNKYSSGQSLLIEGRFSPEPDYIYMNHGTNDRAQSDEAVISSAQGWLNDVRVAAPNAYIFLTIPFGQFKSSALYTAYNNYKAEHATDTRVIVLDLGPEKAIGLDDTTGPNERSVDGLHPNVAANAEMEPLLFDQLRTAVISDNLKIKVVREVDDQPVVGLASSSFSFSGCADVGIHAFSELGGGEYLLALKSGQDCDYSIEIPGYVTATSTTGLLPFDSILDKTASPEIAKFKLKIAVNTATGSLINPDSILFGGNTSDVQVGNAYYWQFSGASSSLVIRKSGYINPEVTNPGLMNIELGSAVQLVINFGDYTSVTGSISSSSNIKGLISEIVDDNNNDDDSQPLKTSSFPLHLLLKDLGRIVAPILGPDTHETNNYTKKAKQALLTVTKKISSKNKKNIYYFFRDLKLGSVGADVHVLQKFLSGQGLLHVKSTGYFGALTKKSLIRYQVQRGIHPAIGYFGRITRLFIGRGT